MCSPRLSAARGASRHARRARPPPGCRLCYVATSPERCDPSTLIPHAPPPLTPHSRPPRQASGKLLQETAATSRGARTPSGNSLLESTTKEAAPCRKSRPRSRPTPTPTPTPTPSPRPRSHHGRLPRAADTTPPRPTSPRHHATTSRCPALRPSVASRAAQWAYWALPGQHSRAPRSASRAAAPQACRVAHNPLRPHSRPRCTFSCASHTVLPPPLPPLFPLAVPCPAPWMPTAPSSATRHDT